MCVCLIDFFEILKYAKETHFVARCDHVDTFLLFVVGGVLVVLQLAALMVAG